MADATLPNTSAQLGCLPTNQHSVCVFLASDYNWVTVRTGTLLEQSQESSWWTCSCSQQSPDQMGDGASQLPGESLDWDHEEIWEHSLPWTLSHYQCERANDLKDLLQLVSNKVCPLPWQAWSLRVKIQCMSTPNWSPFLSLQKSMRSSSNLSCQPKWFPAALMRITNRILYTASNTHLSVDLDECLSDIEILLCTICPHTFLTHVNMALMPPIDSIKDLFPWYNHPSREQFPVCALLFSP